MIVSEHQLEVRYAETDMMGIVYHANYLPWLELGRTQLLKERGLPYKVLESKGYLLPVLEINVKYRRPAHYDDRITIVTTMADRPLVKIRLDYEVKRGDELLATAYSLHAFMNRQGQALKAPKFFLDAFDRIFAPPNP